MSVKKLGNQMCVDVSNPKICTTRRWTKWMAFALVLISLSASASSAYVEKNDPKSSNQTWPGGGTDPGGGTARHPRPIPHADEDKDAVGDLVEDIADFVDFEDEEDDAEDVANSNLEFDPDKLLELEDELEIVEDRDASQDDQLKDLREEIWQLHQNDTTQKTVIQELKTENQKLKSQSARNAAIEGSIGIVGGIAGAAGATASSPGLAVLGVVAGAVAFYWGLYRVHTAILGPIFD